MAMSDCRHFNGYKPCGKNTNCDTSCAAYNKPSSRILLIHLEALGAVTRSTALLPAIRRKFPNCHLTWVTQKPADQILMHNPLIDRVLTTAPDDLLSLSSLEFDVALVIDKGQKAAGVLAQTHADLVFGFTVDPRTGAVLPATPSAEELWSIGLSDHKKFFENKKAETQLAHEALELGAWRRDEYVLGLNPNEQQTVERKRAAWAGSSNLPIVGINTGCSNVIPFKKLTVERHRELVKALLPHYRVVLLGGKEDSVRNQRIAFGLDVLQSSTQDGLRDGITSVAACDIVVTGDSLGMHLAIGLKKWTVAWFGATCSHEIDLYDRGEHVLAKVGCSPCWKRSCDKPTMCYDMVSVTELVEAVHRGAHAISRKERDETCEKQIRENSAPI